MAAKKRSKAQREADMEGLADMYLRGRPQSEMATRFGVSRAQIYLDLRDLRQKWLESSLEKIDERKWIELARLDKLEQVAWEGWERSCQDYSETREMTATEGRSTTVTTRGQCGDPQFLVRVESCIDKRCKILGMYAPTKTDNINRDADVTTDEAEETLRRLGINIPPLFDRVTQGSTN